MRKALVTAILALLVGLQLQAGNTYLVSVGIADYPGTVNDLSLPVRDASAMYMLYTDHVGAKAYLLYDDWATRETIINAMKDLFAEATKDDTVVFFFSGHGVSYGFVAYDDILSYTDLKRIFSSCKARNKMIFADACFSGGIRENKRNTRGSLNRVMLFLSSRDNETSLENPGMENGYFTTALIGALKGGADSNRDRIITARELFVAVSRKVSDMTYDHQHPVMWGNFPDNMPVMNWRKK